MWCTFEVRSEVIHCVLHNLLLYNMNSSLILGFCSSKVVVAHVWSTQLQIQMLEERIIGNFNGWFRTPSWDETVQKHTACRFSTYSFSICSTILLKSLGIFWQKPNVCYIILYSSGTQCECHLYVANQILLLLQTKGKKWVMKVAIQFMLVNA